MFGAVLICAAAFTAALTGCVSTQAETEKIRDMKYEVIEEEDIPQSLREMIKGGEKKPFRITYSDQASSISHRDTRFSRQPVIVWK